MRPRLLGAHRRAPLPAAQCSDPAPAIDRGRRRARLEGFPASLRKDRHARQAVGLSRIADNDAAGVAAQAMLAELAQDNARLAGSLREVHALCDAAGDWAAELEARLDEALAQSFPASDPPSQARRSRAFRADAPGATPAAPVCE